MGGGGQGDRYADRGGHVCTQTWHEDMYACTHSMGGERVNTHTQYSFRHFPHCRCVMSSGQALMTAEEGWVGAVTDQHLNK